MRDEQYYDGSYALYNLCNRFKQMTLKGNSYWLTASDLTGTFKLYLSLIKYICNPISVHTTAQMDFYLSIKI